MRFEEFYVNIFCFLFAKLSDIFGIALVSLPFTVLFLYLAINAIVYKLPDDGIPVGQRKIK